MSQDLPDRQRPAKYPLPNLEDIYEEKELIMKMNELDKILNSPPPQAWIIAHPFATKEIMTDRGKQKVPIDYLPIARVEYLLTRIFVRWKTTIKNVQTIANSVVVTLTLSVLDPITGEWWDQDGLGAAPISTAKGASATDFSQVLTSSVQTASPAAETYAIKDAAEKFGKIFGKDLNRMGEMNYAPMQEAKANAMAELPEELIAVIEECDTLEGIAKLFENNPEWQTNKEFNRRLNQRRLYLREKGGAK